MGGDEAHACCMKNVSEDWTLRAAAAVRLTRTVETAAWLRCCPEHDTNKQEEKQQQKNTAKCAGDRN